MGHKTTIFGFIECSDNARPGNQLELQKFSFDSLFPFRNGFGKFSSTYSGNTVPFSMNFKGDSFEAWGQWIERFEELLAVLDYQCATVVFDSEMQLRRYIVDYVSASGQVEKFEKWTVD